MFKQEYNADICSSMLMPFSQQVDVCNLVTFVDQNLALEINPHFFMPRRINDELSVNLMCFCDYYYFLLFLFLFFSC